MASEFEDFSGLDDDMLLQACVDFEQSQEDGISEGGEVSTTTASSEGAEASTAIASSSNQTNTGSRFELFQMKATTLYDFKLAFNYILFKLY